MDGVVNYIYTRPLTLALMKYFLTMEVMFFILTALKRWVYQPTVMDPLWGFSISKVDRGGFSICLSMSSGGCPSPKDHTTERVQHNHQQKHV